MQEAQIVLAMVLQKFDFAFTDPSYTLELKQTLTIKPKHLFVHALPRRSKKARLLATPSATSFSANKDLLRNTGTAAAQNSHPMYVLYGSNTGTSQGFAQRIADNAAKYGECRAKREYNHDAYWCIHTGFRAALGTLDSAANHVPSDGPIIIVCASFEGEPADNAAHFVQWLASLKGQELANTSYAVFGCGNKEWVSTYQRIPKVVDSAFSERGAKQLIQRGEGDAASAAFFESFDAWEAQLWEVLPRVCYSEMFC
jgi:cytochrome P450 / NADPH-cytochrome P450 reductase